MKSLILVMLGGAAGSALRYLAGLALPAGHGGWPWGTFAVNILGGFAMGVLAAYILRTGEGAEPIRLLLGVGLLGGFTTFSAYSLELVQMVQRGNGLMATSYAMSSVLLGMIAVFIGMAAHKAVLT